MDNIARMLTVILSIVMFVGIFVLGWLPAIKKNDKIRIRVSALMIFIPAVILILAVGYLMITNPNLQ